MFSIAYFKRLRIRNIVLIILGLSSLVVLFSYILHSKKAISSSKLLIAKQTPLEDTKPTAHLVILILSVSTKSATRNVIRKTWLSEKDPRIKHFFVIGSKEINSSVFHDLLDEAALHNDIMFLDSIAENYKTLSDNVLAAFKQLHSSYKFNFVLKCDDDSFIQVPLLLEALTNQPQQHLYWGFFKGGSHVFRQGKWKEPSWFLCDTYLPYALGGGYILSYDLVEYLAASSSLLQHYNSEDVSVGLWLSPLKINRVHDYRFDTEFKSRGCFNQYLITHKQSVDNMQEKKKNLDDIGKMCQTEVRLRYSYNYNWTVPATKCCKSFDSALP
uniref:Hexosyltransferase n=1 Tax=Evadne anonyx TaxID=141404 RepID=A0A9N6WQA3_9CRUS|nr:EOG090X0A8N [Evadne anonyx]